MGDKIMPKLIFELYPEDLTPEALNRLLMEFETTVKDENWDVFPITTLEREVEEPPFWYDVDSENRSRGCHGHH